MGSHTEAKNIFSSSLHWIKDLKQNYLAKSPFEKWSFVRDITNFAARNIGCDFAVKGYKVTLRTWLPAPILANYFTSAMYTLYYFRQDLIQGLMPFSALGLIFPCFIQYILVLMPSTRKKMKNLFNFAGDFIYANSDSTPKKYFICDQLAINLFSKSVKINLLILFSLYLTACGPLYNIFSNSSTSGHDFNQFIIPIIIPFIDPFTQHGFYMNLTNQIIICMLGVIAVPATELLTCVLVNSISVSAAVIVNEITEFEGIIKTKNKNQFRNIIVQMMDFDRFVSDYVDTFYWKFLIQPILLMYAIISCIYLYMLRTVTAAIGCSACCYIQLIILCDAGKTVDDANIFILDALNRFPFYLLSTKQQKMFALLLKCNQKEAKLRIGPFAELNYETATKLTKTMYTYIMCMIRARG